MIDDRPVKITERAEYLEGEVAALKFVVGTLVRGTTGEKNAKSLARYYESGEGPTPDDGDTPNDRGYRNAMQEIFKEAASD